MVTFTQLSYPGCRTFVRVIVLVLIGAYGGLRAGENGEIRWKQVTVSPLEVRDPLLGHRLFPADSERVDGNAAPIILRLGWERRDAYWDEMARMCDRYLDMTVDGFPSARARADVPGDHFVDLRRAAYRRDADWQYLDPPGASFSYRKTHVAELDQTRILLKALAVHCRADISAGNMSDAMDKISTGLSVAAHLSEPPFVVTKLIQARNVEMFLDRVEELIQHDGAPNLYWPLTALPREIIDIRPVVDWERRSPLWRMRGEPQSSDDWRDARRNLAAEVPLLSESNELLVAFRDRALRDLPVIQPGLAPSIGTMSDDELLVRYYLSAKVIESDRDLCVSLLTPAEAIRFFRDRAAALRGREIDPLFLGYYIDNVVEPCVAVWSLRRRIDALRTIEALRDYAARHDAQLPDSLSDVQATAIPDDVFLGRPFEYRREGDRCFVSGIGVEVNNRLIGSIQYEVRVCREPRSKDEQKVKPPTEGAGPPDQK